MDLAREMSLAKTLAYKSGLIAKERQKGLKYSFKQDGSGPVSDVDIFIDNFICSELRKEFPQDQIVSEESFAGEALNTKGRAWLIDPIDGTSSYIKQNQDYAVMIGLLIDAQPVLGIIYHPAKDALFCGLNSDSKKLCEKITNNEVQIISRDCPKRDLTNLRVAVSPFRHSRRQQNLLEQIAPKKLQRRSSIGLKAMMVVDNEADLYVCWSKAMKYWDTCAPLAVAIAANISMSYLDQSQIDYTLAHSHSKPIMVANFKPDKASVDLLKEIAES